MSNQIQPLSVEVSANVPFGIILTDEKITLVILDEVNQQLGVH